MTIGTALIDPQMALQAAQGQMSPAPTQNALRAKQTAQDFEGQFLSQMVEHMFTGIDTEGPFGGGQGEQMFRSLMYDEFGKILARAGGVGIAGAVQREILRAQEVK